MLILRGSQRLKVISDMTDKFVSVGAGIITVSDTRTRDDDRSGDLAAHHLSNHGHRVLRRRIVRDDSSAIQEELKHHLSMKEIFAVILTGGTGITQRDVTPDAVRPFGTKHLPGFGELFRMLSYTEIGSSTIQSRADAWLCDETLVFVLPGSTGAVQLAFEKILNEQLDVRTKPCNFVRLRDRILSE